MNVAGYYFVKVAFMLGISFPQLRIGNLVFSSAVVPLLELLYSYLGHSSIPTAITFLRMLPLLVIAALLPQIVFHDYV
jgi:hypothetical protein